MRTANLSALLNRAAATVGQAANLTANLPYSSPLAQQARAVGLVSWQHLVLAYTALPVAARAPYRSAWRAVARLAVAADLTQ